MNIEAARNPAYLLKLSCMAASVAEDGSRATLLASSDEYSSGVYSKSNIDAEQKEMLRDIEQIVHQACPQSPVQTANVQAVLKQYSLVTGNMAAQLMVSPTTALPFAAALASETGAVVHSSSK